MLRVIVVEESVLMRQALVRLIEESLKLKVVHEGGYEASTIRSLQVMQPSAVVLSFNKSLSLAIRMIDRLHKSCPDVGILGLANRSNHPAFSRLIELGLTGLISTRCEARQLHESIFKVARREHAISPDIAEFLALSLLPSQAASPFEVLTTREMEVAMSLLEGRRMPAIAKQLSVSPKTVATYKYRIYDKLSVDTEVALLKLALQFGVVELDQPQMQSTLF